VEPLSEVEVHFRTRSVTRFIGELTVEANEPFTENDWWPWFSTAAEVYEPKRGDSVLLRAILNHFVVGDRGIMSIGLSNPYVLHIRFNRHLVRRSSELKGILRLLFGRITGQGRVAIVIKRELQFSGGWGSS
jgi:hypothetical protein